MEFRVLGPLEVLEAGTPLPLGGPKQRAVLARLLLDAGLPVSTDALAESVWGEDPPEHARATLQVYVANLRRVLDREHPSDDDHRRLQRRSAGYVLNLLPGDDLDLRRFRRLSRKAHLLRASDPATAAALLRSALQAWNGSPFPDLTSGAIPPPQVDGLEEERLAALEDRIGADLDSGEGTDLVAELEQLVSAHPLRERLHAHRILALYRAGRQADALEAYRRARELLLGELGIDPGLELRRLERAVLEQDPALMSVVPTARALSTLPETPNRLIGRQSELDGVASLLKASDVRLVTVIGPGGTGKTRLSVEVARSLTPEFPDGVFFVALGSVRDQSLVLSTIAATLSVKEVAARPLAALVCDRLDGQRALLVVDNLEHLPAAANQLSELLAHTRGPKMLATSRAALRISAEHEYPLRPLRLPPLSPVPAVADLRCNEAVALFSERARSVLPRFLLDDENTRAIAEICRHLDGLPLAIELAAARIRVLAPRAILERLDARLRLLTGGARDLPERQQTLRNTIAWSYELLNADERTLFTRMGVFAGGCQLDAAETLCGDSGADGHVLEQLDGLVGQSLLQFHDAASGGPRFRMLETIHAYARELLASSGEGNALRAAHAHYYLALAESAAPHLLAAGQAKWMSLLSGEQDNLRAALGWATGSDGENRVALRLAASLWHFWELSGMLVEGRRWLSAVLERADDTPSHPLMRACSGAGTLAWESGDDEVAVGWHKRALDLARRLHDRREEAFALNNLAGAHYDRAEYPEAELLYAQAAELARRAGDHRTYGMAVHNTGEIHFHRGELDRAARCYEEALAIFRDLGDQWLLAVALHGLAMTGIREGAGERATQALHESLQLAAQFGENYWVAENLEAIAALTHRADRLDEAARLLSAADSLRIRIGAPVQPADQDAVHGLRLEVRNGMSEEAFRAAWEAGHNMTVAAVVEEVLGRERVPGAAS